MKTIFKKIIKQKISKKEKEKKKKKREKLKPGAESQERELRVASGGSGRGSGAAQVFPHGSHVGSSSKVLTPGTGGPLEMAHTSAGTQLDSSSLAKRNSVGFFCWVFFLFLLLFF